jgi:predicted lipoprotein with Yx(FWY)xxD motif
MRIRKAARLGAVLAAALTVTLAGAVRADHHVVKVATKEKVGSHLTDAKGGSLYTFKKDSPGKSACTGECVAKWPLYFREKVAVSGNLEESDFGTLTREDGQKQTTYKGMPLYYFVADKAPGDTAGHGVREVWYLAKP